MLELAPEALIKFSTASEMRLFEGGGYFVYQL